MNRGLRITATAMLIAVLTSTLAHAPSVQAATSRYTLRWSFDQNAKYMRSDAIRVVMPSQTGTGWSIDPATAPNPSMTKTSGDPCSVTTSTSRFGKATFTIEPSTVSNGKALQECNTKLTGPSGWSPKFPSPSAIQNTYYVLSNEKIPLVDNGGVLCVAECRYKEGRPANIWRLKPAPGSTEWRWCFYEEYPPILVDHDVRRDPYVVEVPCPHRINFNKPANRYENSTFTVKASSSLGRVVKLESLTPGVCSVKSTNTTQDHRVTSSAVDRRRTCELRASATGGTHEASATATESFYVNNRTGSGGGDLDDGDYPVEKDQAITVELPSSLMEYSSTELKGTSSSGLPVSWAVSGNCYVDGNRVVMRAFPQGVCDVTASQEGQPGVWNPAAIAESRIEILCSEEYSCRPPLPPAPELSGTISDTTPAWMRLGTDETIRFAADLVCAGSTKVSATRCDAASPSRFVGAYLVIDSVTVTSFDVLAPTGYPQNRWSILTKPTSIDPRGVLRFSQATSASQKFKLTYSAAVAYRQVQWSNFLGSYQETVTSGVMQYDAVTKSFGVVGATG